MYLDANTKPWVEVMFQVRTFWDIVKYDYVGFRFLSQDPWLCKDCDQFWRGSPVFMMHWGFSEFWMHSVHCSCFQVTRLWTGFHQGTLGLLWWTRCWATKSWCGGPGDRLSGSWGCPRMGYIQQNSNLNRENYDYNHAIFWETSWNALICWRFVCFVFFDGVLFLFAKDGKLYNALQFKKFYDKESVTMVKSQKTVIFLWGE